MLPSETIFAVIPCKKLRCVMVLLPFIGIPRVCRKGVFPFYVVEARTLILENTTLVE
jgi:hypothetical protein